MRRLINGVIWFIGQQSRRLSQASVHQIGRRDSVPFQPFFDCTNRSSTRSSSRATPIRIGTNNNPIQWFPFAWSAKHRNGRRSNSQLFENPVAKWPKVYLALPVTRLSLTWGTQTRLYRTEPGDSSLTRLGKISKWTFCRFRPNHGQGRALCGGNPKGRAIGAAESRLAFSEKR
jgi:hypothetical protein